MTSYQAQEWDKVASAGAIHPKRRTELSHRYRLYAIQAPGSIGLAGVGWYSIVGYLSISAIGIMGPQGQFVATSISSGHKKSHPYRELGLILRMGYA